MWDLLDRIFATNLELGNADGGTQSEIFKYAIKEKNYDLLTKLANYQFLDPNIVTSFNNNNSSEVRKIWLVCKNIKSKDVINLLSKEKRLAVLEAVASSTRHREKVFTFLYDNTTDADIMHTLLNNDAVNAKLKVKILIKSMALKSGKSSGVGLSVFASELMYSDDNTLLNEILAEPKLLKLTCVIIDHNGIKPSEILIVHGVIADEITKLTKKLSDNDTFSQEDKVLSDSIALTLSKLELSKNQTSLLKQKLLEFNTVAKGKSSNELHEYINSTFKGIVTKLEGSSKSVLAEITQEVSLAKHNKDMITIFNKVTKLFGSEILNYRERDKIRMILADSPASDFDFSVSMINLIEGLYTPLDFSIYLKRPQTYAYALATTNLVNVKEALTLSSDPKLCFEVLLNTYVANEGYVPDPFFEEGLIGEEEILNLPVELISLSGFPKEVETTVMNIISRTLTSPANWEVFTTLSKNFEGSLKELLNIAAKI